MKKMAEALKVAKKEFDVTLGERQHIEATLQSHILQLEQQQEVAANKADVYQKKRQSLLADAALGINQADESVLQPTAVEAEESEKAVSLLAGVVAGLQNKLANMGGEVEVKKQTFQTLRADYIRAKAQNLHGAYMSHAAALLDLLQQIDALGRIYESGYSPDSFSDGTEWKELSIPVFAFPSSGQFPRTGSETGHKWSPAHDYVHDFGNLRHTCIYAEQNKIASETGVNEFHLLP